MRLLTVNYSEWQKCTNLILTKTNSHGPVTPLTATTGTQDKRFFPFLPNSDFFVSSDFTISPICGCSANWLSPGILICHQ